MQMPPSDFLTEFNRVIDTCRNILRLDGITGMDSMKHLTLYILARVLTIQECKRLSISEKFSWDKFMELLSQDKKQEAFNLFFCKNGAEADLIGALDEKFNTKNFNYKLNKIELHASILKELNKVDLTNLDGQVDILGTVYENHLGSGSNKSAMRDLGQFFTDRKVCNYMVNLCEPKALPGKRAESVLDPTMGTGGFMTSYVKYLKTNGHTIDWSKMQDDVVGCDIDEFVVSIGEINMYLSTGVLFNRISHRDSLQNDVGESDQRLKFKIILANEPFGVKGLKFADSCKRVKDLGINGTKSEPLFLNLMMAALDDGGRCAVVVPDGVLVNNSNQHNGTRKYLLDNFELKRVIKMKGQFFSNTGIQPSILFFENTGNPTTIVEFWEVEQGSHGTIVENILLSVPREKFDDACSLDMRRYQEVAVVVNTGGYPIVKLGDYIEDLKTGKNKNDLIKGDYPFYMSNGISQYANTYQFDGEYVLTGRCGSLNGSQYYVNGKFSASDFTYVIKPKDGLTAKYLYYCLLIVDWTQWQTGTTMKGIRREIIVDLKIPLPPLPIQQEIVTALDLIYNNAATAKAAAASVKSQMAAVVRSVGARGFERKKLGEVTSMVNGYAFKSEEFIETGVPVVKITTIKENKITFEKACYVPSNNKLNNFIVKNGDFVIALSGTVGIMGMNLTGIDCYLNQRVARIDVTSDETSSKFVFLYMIYSDIIEKIREMAGGSAQPNISTKKIEEIEIPVPPLPIQHEVLAILNEMEAELATLEQMAAKAEQRAKFILDGYLTPAPIVEVTPANTLEVPLMKINSKKIRIVSAIKV